MEDNSFGGSWSAEKLDRVENYVHAYLTAMTRFTLWDYVYIDAFAGSGYQLLKGDNQATEQVATRLFVEDEASSVADYLIGSALRAIAASESEHAQGHASFSKLFFIDKSKDNLDSLRARIQEQFPGALAKSEFIQGDANIRLPEVVGKIDWAKTRGIVFLDPFDMAIEHDALSSISSTEALDAWILFPLMATVRVMARDGVPDSGKNKIDKMYGSREWEEFIYSTSSQLTLFDNDAKSRLYRREGFDDILAYTTKWLKELFADASDSPYLLRNRKGMPLFALYSAISSHNPSAINLWKKISSHLLSA